MKAITFADQVRAQFFAGDGGNGVATFRREKFIPKGGPDGGDGGDGGSIYLRASKDVPSLIDLYYSPIVRAQRGQNGRSRQQYGRAGADTVVPVPPGTVATDEETGEILGEVLSDGDTLLVAQGGRHGLGNLHFKSSTHQAPTEHTEGTKGEVRTLVLTMKTVAEIGLVGYPNAGKSTLLRAISNARPKTGAYPFTTLHPHVGTVTLDPTHAIRVADVPGIVEGAHAGVGLGHRFLRHVERAGRLLYVLDMAGTDARSPLDDYRTLLDEIARYSPDLAARPSLVVANKMDLPAARKNLAAFKKATGLSPLPLSAATGKGIDALKAEMAAWFFPGETLLDF
jgi:GTP-binding protein